MRIATRTQALTVGLVAGTAAAIGAISVGGYGDLAREQQERSIGQLVRGDSLRLEFALKEAVHDTRMLATLPGVEETLLRAADSAATTNDEVVDGVAAVMLEALRAKPYYAQVRLIGTAGNGKEVVRVERDEDSVYRTPDQGLQSKGERDYYLEALEQSPSEIYISPISLNQERGQLEVPHRPMLRVAARIDHDGRPLGIVIINIDYREFIDIYLRPSQSEGEVIITNEAGDYLTHPDASRTFGFDLGSRNRLQDDYPSLGPFFVDSEVKAATLVLDGGGILGVVKTPAFPGQPDRYLGYAMVASNQTLADAAAAITRRAFAATIGLTAASIALAVLASRSLVRPIGSLTAAAKTLASGGAAANLPVSRSDELGDLARAFHQMAADIHKKESELKEANTRLVTANEDLDHFTHIAAHDLREPLRKQRNLVDLLMGGPVDDEVLHSISNCSSEMQGLIDDFRALTRLEESCLQREPTSLRDLAEQAVCNYAAALQQRGVNLRFDSFPESSLVYPRLVLRLYDNLIRNSLQHTKCNGFELAFTATRSGDGWLYGVRNTGATIAPDQCKEVFRLFRKASPDGGTGVGLSVCRKVVDRHRGTIRAESTDDSVHILFTLGGKSDDPEAAK